jgi:AcrR family transcriptional regulator
MHELALDDASKQSVELGGGMSARTPPERLVEKLTSAAAGFAVTFDDVGMDDIAAASGIPRATLYYYFAGKDEVLSFLLRSMLDDLRVSVSTAEEAGGDVRERLRSVMRAQFAHLAANPAAAQLLLMNLGRAGRLGVIASGIETGFQEPVRRILGEGVTSGRLIDIDVESIATAMYGAITIVGLSAIVRTGALDADAATEDLFPVFWTGMSVPAQQEADR